MLRLGETDRRSRDSTQRISGRQRSSKVFCQTSVRTEQAPAVIVRTKSDKPSIAFIGNFKGALDRKSNLVGSEQGLGYEVEKLQENKISLQEIRSACSTAGCCFGYTPGWLRVPERKCLNCWNGARTKASRRYRSILTSFSVSLSVRFSLERFHSEN